MSKTARPTASALPTMIGMSRPPRLPGFGYLGTHRYILSCCTYLRQPHFSCDEIAIVTLTEFRRTAEEDQFAVLAYCLMPDHAHLLVEGLSDSSDLRRFMRIGKQRSAYRYSVRSGGCRLWQGAFHDRILREDQDVRRAARYVIENPVRAGLVDSPEKYQHCGSDVWTIETILEF